MSRRLKGARATAYGGRPSVHVLCNGFSVTDQPSQNASDQPNMHLFFSEGYLFNPLLKNKFSKAKAAEGKERSALATT